MQAADAAGYGLCVSIGEFDSSGLLINGTERVVHNPTLWNGTGRPDWDYVGGTYSLPGTTPGTPVACYTWNGKEMVLGKTSWPGTVPTPATLDPTELDVRAGETTACGTTGGILTVPAQARCIPTLAYQKQTVHGIQGPPLLLPMTAHASLPTACRHL